MKKLILFILIVSSSNLIGQEMEWVRSNNNSSGTDVVTDCAKSTICYDLSYKPKQSGVMTSYTTGFSAACENSGVEVLMNQSSVMTDNSTEIYACDDYGLLLVNCSGNTGQLSVKRGQSVVLHQLCFKLKNFEDVKLKIDEITGLSVSLDVTPEKFITDLPALQNLSTRSNNVFPCKIFGEISLESNLVESKTIHLKWNTVSSSSSGNYIIKRSLNGGVQKEIETIYADQNNNLEYMELEDKNLKGGTYEYVVEFVSEGDALTSNLTSREIEQSSTLTLYPNPTSKICSILFNDGGTDADLLVYDTESKLLTNIGIKTNSVYKLDASNYAAGLYVVRVKGEYSTLEKKLIVIK